MEKTDSIEKSHIWKARKIIENIVKLDSEYYYPLIRQYLIYQKLYTVSGIERIKFFIKLKQSQLNAEKLTTKDVREIIDRFGIKGEFTGININTTREEIEQENWNDYVRENHPDFKQFKNADECEMFLKKEIIGEEGILKIIKCCLSDEEFNNDSGCKKVKNELLLELFNHLAISVFRAEYLIFDNYSNKLIELSGFEDENSFEIKEWVRDVSREQIDDNSHVDHQLIRYFIQAIWYLIEQCKVIEHCINPKKYQIPLTILNKDKELRADAVYPFHYEYAFVPKEIIRIFELAFQSIVDLAAVDHSFYATEENLEKALLSIDRLRSLRLYLIKDIKEENPKAKDVYNKHIENEKKEKVVGKEFDIIIDIAYYKAWAFIYQIGKYRENTHLENYFDPNNMIVSGIKKSELEIFCKKSPIEVELLHSCINNKFKYFSKEVKVEDIIEPLFLSHIDENFTFLKQNHNDFQDINTFNQAAFKGIKLYCDLSKLVTLCKESDLANTEKIIDEIKKNENNIAINPSILFYILNYLKKALYCKLEEQPEEQPEKQPEEEKVKKWFDLYIKYLSMFGEFVNQKSNVAFLKFQPPFQCCYYTYTFNDKTISNPIQSAKLSEEDIINYTINENNSSDKYPFFSFSAGLPPVDFDFLKDVYKKHADRLLELSSKVEAWQYGTIISLKSKKTIENFSEQNKEQVRDIISEKVSESNRNTMTILGILGAFLAFVTLSVGTIKTIDNIYKYFLFALIFVFSLLSFVFAIRFRLEKKDKKWFYFFVFISITVLYLLSVWGFHNIFKEQINEPNPEIIHRIETIIEQKQSDEFKIIYEDKNIKEAQKVINE